MIICTRCLIEIMLVRDHYLQMFHYLTRYFVVMNTTHALILVGDCAIGFGIRQDVLILYFHFRKGTAH